MSHKRNFSPIQEIITLPEIDMGKLLYLSSKAKYEEADLKQLPTSMRTNSIL